MPWDADTELADPDAVSVGNRRDARDFVRSGYGGAGGENGQDRGENPDQAHLVHVAVPSWAAWAMSESSFGAFPVRRGLQCAGENADAGQETRLSGDAVSEQNLAFIPRVSPAS